VGSKPKLIKRFAFHGTPPFLAPTIRASHYNDDEAQELDVMNEVFLQTDLAMFHASDFGE